MNLTELIDQIGHLPAKALDTPVLVYISGLDWLTIKSLRFDEDRVVVYMEPFQ